MQSCKYRSAKEAMTLTTFFSGGSIDRSALLRSDPVALTAAWQDPNTRFIAIWQSRCIVEGDAAVLLDMAGLGNDLQMAEAVYLGHTHDHHLFAVELPENLAPQNPPATAFDNFRSLLVNLNEADAAMLAYAKGMLEWQKRHRYCGECGTANTATEGGFVMQCSAATCAVRSFPRLDPAIIVLTMHADRCLLGRQTEWPEGRYSTIAGFVEPGESLEDAVARELLEETNVQISQASYMGSQPWPFPNAIMLGFHARATTTDIKLNDGELADARWFTRDDLTAGEIALPPPQSIAFRLIEEWFNQWDGPPLTDYDLSTDFTRKPAEQDN
jgi:NAD+ diphosphatase